MQNRDKGSEDEQSRVKGKSMAEMNVPLFGSMIKKGLCD